MADKQPAPQAYEVQTQPGSLWEAQEALLGLMESEEEKPETEEAAPTEEEESTEETQDESLEEESEEEAEESDEDEEEESEESVEDDDDEEEPLFPVMANGEEIEVTYDELIKGYSRQADYTTKTQKLAEQHRSLETLENQWKTELAQTQQERMQYANNLEQIIQSSSSNLERFNIDWERLKEEDKEEYLVRREEFRDAQDKINQARANYQQAMQTQQYEQQRMLDQTKIQEHEKLAQLIPEWTDDSARNNLAADIRSYALTKGFSEEELSNLVDSRSVLVLRDAMEYSNLMSADVKSKKLKNKPKVVRSGMGKDKKSDSNSKRAAKMKRLRSSGNVDDAASILEDLYNS